jgi:hypothetical protein
VTKAAELATTESEAEALAKIGVEAAENIEIGGGAAVKVIGKGTELVLKVIGGRIASKVAQRAVVGAVGSLVGMAPVVVADVALSPKEAACDDYASGKVDMKAGTCQASPQFGFNTLRTLAMTAEDQAIALKDVATCSYFKSLYAMKLGRPPPSNIACNSQNNSASFIMKNNDTGEDILVRVLNRPKGQPYQVQLSLGYAPPWVMNFDNNGNLLQELGNEWRRNIYERAKLNVSVVNEACHVPNAAALISAENRAATDASSAGRVGADQHP